MNTTRILMVLSLMSMAACSDPRIEVTKGDTTSAADTPIADGDTTARIDIDTSAPPADTNVATVDSTLPVYAASMRTGMSHTLVKTGLGLEGRIPYSYRNRMSDSVFLTNCNGDVSPGLQLYANGTWKDFWFPTMNECLSAPVVIAPGTTYNDTLRISIYRDDAAYTNLLVGNSSGIYRLIWHQALTSFDAKVRGFGKKVPMEHAVSSPFRLQVAQ